MSRLFLFPATAAAILALTGCLNPLDLTPQQQANLSLWAQAGKSVVRASATLYCVLEPTTSKVIQVLDTSSGTAKTLTKVDQATTILCQSAAAAGLVVTP